MAIDYEIKRDSTINWILGPVGRCLDFLTAETAMAGLLIRSLVSLSILEPLMQIALPQVKRLKGAQVAEQMRRVLTETASFGTAAKEPEAEDFALINGHALIAVWSAFETCIEDTIVLILMNGTIAAGTAAGKIPKLHIQASGVLDENEARRAFRTLERIERQKNSVMESYDSLLQLFEIERSPGRDYSLEFSEVNALRNSLVHRAGRIDQAAVRQALTLSGKVGQKIQIGREQYLKYYDAISGYVQEMLEGIVKSRFIRSKGELQRSET